MSVPKTLALEVQLSQVVVGEEPEELGDESEHHGVVEAGTAGQEGLERLQGGREGDEVVEEGVMVVMRGDD